ncbi:acyl-CoA thioesterase [Salinimicrobium sp. GXAS 041]|uniref:acyl-CoA thioesterase n=1 Tax=Salinimicrobium sp. GXAS 041 TaxID=3400806 RepID=UPI003C78B3A7
MKSYTTYVKVRYAETDQMGVVYHGNYAQYLELARIEWLNDLGISYKKMEEEGIMLPVFELNVKFKKSAKFDDVLRIETRLCKQPGVRIEFDYKIFNQNDELLTEAHTTLVFMDVKQNKPIRCPRYVLDKLNL